MLVSNCRWEVGDVSTLNIGETVVSYQTMKYKFNYTPLVKFLNLNFSWDILCLLHLFVYCVSYVRCPELHKLC